MQKAEDFKAAMRVEPCVRSNVPPLIGLYGESGGGKTVTGLVALVGFLGPTAVIGGVDTENKRMGFAADIVKGMAAAKFGKEPTIHVVNIEPGFNPLKYVAALEMLEAQGCQGFIVDSMSHAWGGIGGYLDLKEQEIERMTKGEDWKRDRVAMAAAARIKPYTHSKLIATVLQLKRPTVLCFRSKDKVRMGKDEKGKTTIEVDPYASPVQESGLSYDMLVSGEVGANADGQGGYCRWVGPERKHTHPALLKILPPPEQQFTFDHAAALAHWIANVSGAPAPATGLTAVSQAMKKPIPGGADPTFKNPEAVKAKWIEACTKAGGGHACYALEVFIEEGILLDTEGLEDFPIDKIPTTKQASEAFLSKIRSAAGVSKAP